MVDPQHVRYLRPASSEQLRGGAFMNDRRFVAAVSPYIMDMLHLAIALIGVSDAEDAAQEALLRAWRAAPTLRESDTVRAWLLRITSNVCHDWHRGGQGTWARLTVPLPNSADDAPALWAPADADPGSNAATLRLDVRQLVDLLEEDSRVVVVLRYYVEMNATDIGAVLGIPASTVRTRLQRALAQLRALDDQAKAHPQTRIDR